MKITQNSLVSGRQRLGRASLLMLSWNLSDLGIAMTVGVHHSRLVLSTVHRCHKKQSIIRSKDLPPLYSLPYC